MKKFPGYIIAILLLITSCTENDAEKEKFMRTYKEIIIAREKYSDSSRANEEVRKILEKHGYSEPVFRRQFLEFAEDHEEFIIMLDSARERAKKELLMLDTARADAKEKRERTFRPKQMKNLNP